MDLRDSHNSRMLIRESIPEWLVELRRDGGGAARRSDFGNIPTRGRIHRPFGTWTYRGRRRLAVPWWFHRELKFFRPRVPRHELIRLSREPFEVRLVGD